MVNEGVPVPVAILLSLLFAGIIGSFTGFLITVLRIDSIITTIAMMSILDALGSAANGGNQVLSLPSAFLTITTFSIFGIAMPFWYFMVVAAVVWYVLTQTPAGRYLYSIGGGEEAARLAGVQVKRLVFIAYVASAVTAAVAGIVVASKVGVGDYSVGDAYLFPAASAMFFGSTQVKPGTFNVWGTVIAVYVLGTIVEGLELGGAPYWLPNVADGVALLIAVGVGNLRFGTKPAA
jgi:ribose transport system permease protein